MLAKMLPNAAKKTRRLMGLRNSGLKRNVVMMKQVPSKDSTEHTLSVISMADN